MIMVKKLYDAGPEPGAGEEETTTVTNKWVPHNEREQQLYDYQESVKTAEQEAAAWSNKSTKEFLEEHSNLLGSPMLDDDRKQFVPEGSGGGSGYVEKEMPIYWVADNVYHVEHISDGYYIATVVSYDSNITDVENGTTGVFVINGVEYNTVKRATYAGSMVHYLEVQGQDESTLFNVYPGGSLSIQDSTNLFPDIPVGNTGDVQISSYYIGKDLEIDPLFEQAVTKFSNVLFLGTGSGTPVNVTNSIAANASDIIAFNTNPSIPVEANYYRVTTVYPLNGKLLNNYIGFVNYFGDPTVSVTLTNVSGAEVTAEDINQNCFIELEFYKITM